MALKALFHLFLQLSCTLINAVREFSSEILHSHIQRMANYLVHQASIEPNLYPYVLWSTWLTPWGFSFSWLGCAGNLQAYWICSNHRVVIRTFF